MMPNANSSVLRLGARGSLLSRLQSGLIAKALEAAHPGLRVELVIISTSGDRIQDRPLHEFGGKGLFTKELELALLRGEIDFAVHSFKDVPVTMPLVDTAELVIAAVPVREDPRDVVVSAGGRTLKNLPRGARVGTGSLRRQAQVLAQRPDVAVLPLRGNVDTRVRKLKAGEYDAVILAAAGLKRAGLFDRGLMTALEVEDFLPAAGQGALAIQCRGADARVRALLGAINDPDTALAVELERDIVKRLNGDCHSPIAALAWREGERVILRAAVAARDGVPPVIHAEAEAAVSEGRGLSAIVAQRLLEQGAAELLAGGTSK